MKEMERLKIENERLKFPPFCETSKLLKTRRKKPLNANKKNKRNEKYLTN